jgi:hypothetical protein
VATSPTRSGTIEQTIAKSATHPSGSSRGVPTALVVGHDFGASRSLAGGNTAPLRHQLHHLIPDNATR